MKKIENYTHGVTLAYLEYLSNKLYCISSSIPKKGDKKITASDIRKFKSDILYLEKYIENTRNVVEDHRIKNDNIDTPNELNLDVFTDDLQSLINKIQKHGIVIDFKKTDNLIDEINSVRKDNKNRSVSTETLKNGKFTKNVKPYYKNREEIRNAHISFIYTDLEQVEYIRCATDPIYFIETYCKIVNPNVGQTNIKLREHQKKIIDSVYRNRNVYVEKRPRQSGVSLVFKMIALHKSMFRYDETCGIKTYKQHCSSDYLDSIIYTYYGLPYFLKAGVLKIDKDKIIFDNGCSINVMKSRGVLTYNNNFVDELDHLSNEDKKNFYDTCLPRILVMKNENLIINSHLSLPGNSYFTNLFCGLIKDKPGDNIIVANSFNGSEYKIEAQTNSDRLKIIEFNELRKNNTKPSGVLSWFDKFKKYLNI